ncbi:uncharacterized protein BO97DRAFT_335747, partial [Aspergillus homomorphus CBS 101889]
DDAWAKCDEIFELWKNKIFEHDVLRDIGRFVDKHRGGVPEQLFGPERGSFHFWFQMQFSDEGSAVIRFPCPGASMFPEEKVKREVAVIEYLEYFTNLRVPHVLHYGMTEESPRGLGPFIIMEHTSNEGDFIDAINIPGRSRDERAILDPNVSQERLELVYSQMADIMLQLSKQSFTEIGCIGKANEGDKFDDRWVVKHRSLTFNMNETVLPTFIQVLQEREQAAIDRGTLTEADRLSGHMLDSWHSGDFWLNYAARKSWAFDMIYWVKIDRRFFGDGDLDSRLQLLTPEDREQMEVLSPEKQGD